MVKVREKQAKKHALTPEMEAVKWKPGQSGNPKGRPPKELCITSLIKEELEEVLRAEGGNITFARAFAKALIRKAIKGHNVAMKELLERVDGKVPLPLEHGGKGGGPMRFNVTLTDGKKKGGNGGNGNGSK